MRVFIADKLTPAAAAHLQDGGAVVTVEADLDEAALIERIATFDPAVLVVRSTKVTRAMIDRGRSLSLIIRAGAGVNTIDLDAASQRGVYVTNCPGKNAAAVAELTIGHLINLDRRIADNVAELRKGRWDKGRFGKAPGLHGRTLAVLGVGTIGREVIVRARALGMTIRAWSRSLTDELAASLDIERAATPEAAVRGADAVTVHLALTPETRGRIGQSLFGAMRPGAYFINTSRGEVIDAAALRAALDEKGILAGLDVFDVEPSGAEGEFVDPIGSHPNVYGTHHIGASTAEASEAVGQEVVRIVEAFRLGAPIPNCVNLAPESDATHRLVVRHADRVGVLAGVLDALRRAAINVQEMQNILFLGGEAACARIAIVGIPPMATLDEIRAIPDVFNVEVTASSRRVS